MCGGVRGGFGCAGGWVAQGAWRSVCSTAASCHSSQAAQWERGNRVGRGGGGGRGTASLSLPLDGAGRAAARAAAYVCAVTRRGCLSCTDLGLGGRHTCACAAVGCAQPGELAATPTPMHTAHPPRYSTRSVRGAPADAPPPPPPPSSAPPCKRRHRMHSQARGQARRGFSGPAPLQTQTTSQQQ